MNLKAWVVFTSAGAVVKQLNVAGVVRNSAGNYTVTFSAAMSGVSYLCRSSAFDYVGANATATTSAKTAAGVTLQLNWSGAGTDMGALLEFYE
ncbi:hypothetical protein DBR12_06180 [Acidovorax sp. HMWF029]|nr:hypothetical protein DBR12_06180 [Acidovorax sp. HMWF029]